MLDWVRDQVTKPSWPGQGDGQYPLIDYWIGGWGIATNCVVCNLVKKHHTGELIDRFWKWPDLSARDLIAKASCSVCRKQRLICWTFASVPVDTGHRAQESRAIREAAIRQQLAAKAEAVSAASGSRPATPDQSDAIPVDPNRVRSRS